MASESNRTKFRRALQTALAKGFAAVELPIEFQGGVIGGPQQNRDIGCVWFEGKRPQSRDLNNEEAFFQVRVLRRFKQDQGGAEPREEVNTELERTFELLEDVLRANINRPALEASSGESLAGWEDFFIVTEMTMNHEQQYVQAAVQAWARNRTSRGG